MSRLLSSSIWHKKKLIIIDTSYLVASTVKAETVCQVGVSVGSQHAGKASGKTVTIALCFPVTTHLPSPPGSSFQVSTSHPYLWVFLPLPPFLRPVSQGFPLLPSLLAHSAGNHCL